MAKTPAAVLGIETSCDETAVAIVTLDRKILANEILSQFKDHEPYGGVVPEIAARNHAEHVDLLIEKALQAAKIKASDLEAIAATAGPGLIGGVMVGTVAGKALALGTGKPFIAINHLEGHALSIRLMERVKFPYLLLLISGGHCQLISVNGIGEYRRLGTTIDDAAGEAFDKTAKLLGLGLPGGPNIETWAKQGNARRFPFPRPLCGRPGADFSFSGLKTAVRRQAEKLANENGAIKDQDVSDIAASFQAAVSDCLSDRTRTAMRLFTDFHGKAAQNPAFVVAGGVASNRLIRQELETVCASKGFSFHAPPLWLCTDNGAMIAWAGIERHLLGIHHDLDFAARARWPLDETSETKVGSGKKGAKV